MPQVMEGQAVGDLKLLFALCRFLPLKTAPATIIVRPEHHGDSEDILPSIFLAINTTHHVRPENRAYRFSYFPLSPHCKAIS